MRSPCVNVYQNEPVVLQQLVRHLMNLIEYGFVRQIAIHHHEFRQDQIHLFRFLNDEFLGSSSSAGASSVKV